MRIELSTFEDSDSPEIARILDELKEIKKNAIALGDEERANNCWRELEALELNLIYIKAFHKIKNKQYREAWYDLEQCEIKCQFIQENSSKDFCAKTRVSFIGAKALSWQSLYPYCVFSSPGFTVGYYTCSICDHKIRPRSRCAHSKGKIYNGELCLHVGHDLELKEISIVSKPVQKYSVVHNDETLDFSLIEYLIDFLEDAFEEWGAIRTRMKFPIEKFSRVKLDQDCPCKGGGRFGDCCSTKSEIEIPHVDFVFHKEISNPAEIRFPY
ncbi:zinc chelation protein SecC [Pseudomonas cavernae]|uniref:zinc chelation protein SecC n=1 Tax=Pseudomonas cavernae TaxID=2320867 RepID=UPI0013C42434|nr:zinc chelation protein SecC [Pseudomonas cavernae]